MTEGRGSNAGTCLINLKPWSERKHNVKEIMEELEEKSEGSGRGSRILRTTGNSGFRFFRRFLHAFTG
jgi:HAE1 family hydrophobic/amphiphilic exporter-1